MSKKYSQLNLGLDIGTNSVGYALLDQNNQLVKKNGFTFWGVRMFDEANTAADRRGFRNSRRRIRRRKERIDLLQGIFKKEIESVDPTFFQRLNDSFLKQEDKKYNNYYNLFNGEYTDKEFFKTFPTIYHLRKSIMESEEKVDIRCLYLACHNIIKYRGNFLQPGEEFNKSDNEHLKYCFEKFNDILRDCSKLFEEQIDSDYFQLIDKEFNDEFFEEFGKVLNDVNGKNEKTKKLIELFGVEKKTLVSDYLIKLIIGSKVNLEKLPCVRDYDYEKSELSVVGQEDLENALDELVHKCPELYDLIYYALDIKDIIDKFYLLKLLKGYDSLSDAMVAQYEIHKKDLGTLKELVRKYLPEKYNECFKEVNNDKLNNYPRYIGMNNVDGDLRRFGHCSREDFYVYVKGLLTKIKDLAENDSETLENINNFLIKIENDEFLPRQNSDKNGSIPMQLHLSELKQMLKKQSKYYSFLEEKSDGVTNLDKIISIFKFKIPYYVGPLVGDKSPFGWAIRKNEDRIYPWNLEEVIDVDETARKFINRMQRKCTYLKGEDDYCLPKKSILFSKYNCLSFINKLTVDGALIDLKTKKEIFNEVFLKIAKPTKKDLKLFFYKMGKRLDDKYEVNCDMSSYIKFVEIFGKEYVDNNIDTIERVISDINIFEDKKILETRLRNLYKFGENEIKQIKGLTYSGYSNLCRNLLSGIRSKNQNNGINGQTIIEIMEETNLNLQEILFSDLYRLQESIDEYNEKVLSSKEETLNDFIDQNIALNPGMRRAMIQSIHIIEEIENAIGQKIDYYYIECERQNKTIKGEKGKKKSRFDSVRELYENSKDIARKMNIDLGELQRQLDEVEKNKYDDKIKNDIMRADRIYLYFTQLGRCMYSLEKIDFDQLIQSDNLTYDIDHIYPQSLIKDDSLSNRVLVKKSLNNKKKDKFTFEVPNLINSEAFEFYSLLQSKGLISNEKFKRLTKREITGEELDGFVNRQLVSTSQAVKGVVTVLKYYNKVDPTHIVFSKAENISDFRKEYGLVKSRTANNYHHAHDAYLNVVVGRAINSYFTINHLYDHNDLYRMRSENKTINVSKVLERDIKINGNYIWDVNFELGVSRKYDTPKEKRGQIFKDLYDRFDITETTMPFNSKNMLSKVTIKSAGSGKVPVKNDARGNIDKYGGMDSYKYAQYTLVKQKSKAGYDFVLYPIPTPFVSDIEGYLQNSGVKDFEIVIDNIKTNEVICRENTRSYITGVTNGSFLLKNAIDRNFSYKALQSIKMIDSYYDNLKSGRQIEKNNDSFIIHKNRFGTEDKVLTKEDLDSLYQEIYDLFSKKCFGYSNIKNILNLMENGKSLDMENKIEVINQLLRLLKTDERNDANLTIIGGSSHSGVMAISKTLKPGDKIIRYSYTGYYKHILFEVKNGI